MADPYTSHFSLNNIPYGIASSSSHPEPQCTTRIHDKVVFLADLVKNSTFFENIAAPLTNLFLQPTLNVFAAQPREVHLKVRRAIQEASKDEASFSSASENVGEVTLHMPVQIGDFTDYSASSNHVLNAGEAVTGVRSYPPAFHKYPVGYAGRCSSIAVSPAAVTRPLGQFVEDYTVAEKNIIFGPSRALDYEFEIGAIIGRPTSAGTRLNARDADEHIFGLVLVNDWSARDIQALEMPPLGPFNGKNFGTSISPWVITMEALKPFEVAAPERMAPVAEFMNDPKGVNYDLRLEGVLKRNGTQTTTCRVNFDTMYWTFRHMIAHHTIGGCELRTGDLVASGTVSGEQDHEHGCLLEMTFNGKKPGKLSDGSEVRYLEDGDEVTYTGIVGDASAGVGFGAIHGAVKPARQ